MLQVAILINPRAGVRRGDAVAQRREMSRAALRDHGSDGEVVVADGCGRGRAAARKLLEQGVETVVVWGGDGTVNEVASQLVGSGVTLGIVPVRVGQRARAGTGPAHGSGPCAPGGPPGAGPLDRRGRAGRPPVLQRRRGRLRCASGGGVQCADAPRGVAGYAAAAIREAARYVPGRYTVTADGAASSGRALLVAVANTRQYGNRAPSSRPAPGRMTAASSWSSFRQLGILSAGCCACPSSVPRHPAPHARRPDESAAGGRNRRRRAAGVPRGRGSGVRRSQAAARGPRAGAAGPRPGGLGQGWPEPGRSMA